jgi:hypothetical protein
MAEAAEKSTPVVAVEPYAEPAGVRRPPYFGEREPTVHIIGADGEKVYLRPTPYTMGVMEGVRYLAERLKLGERKRHRRHRRDAIEAVAKEIWPADGLPPESTSTPLAVQRLGRECDVRGILNTIDTLKRVIGRR